MEVERWPARRDEDAVAVDEAEARRFHELGILAVVERGIPRGRDIAAAVLVELGCDPTRVTQWSRQISDRELEKEAPAVATA